MNKKQCKNIFPLRLKTARKEVRGWSQVELATITGLKPAAISFFETGARKPCLENLVKLADGLEVTTDYLLGRSEFY